MTQEQFDKMHAAAQGAAMYKDYADIPDWGKPTVKRLMDAGALQGDGAGLNLTPEMLRTFVVNDRMGIYK